MIGGRWSRTLLVAHARDERHAPVDAARVDPLDELDRLVGRDRRADLDADRVRDQRRERDVGAVELAGAVADPQLVRREQEQPVLVQPQQRALVVEHEHLVADEQLDRAQRAVVDAAGRHEPQAALDLAATRS